MSVQKFWEIIANELSNNSDKYIDEWKYVNDWNKTEIMRFLDDFERELKARKQSNPKLFEHHKANIPTSIHYDTFVAIFQKRTSSGKEGTRNAFAIYFGYDSMYHCLNKRKFHTKQEFTFKQMHIKYDLRFNRERLQIDSIKTVKVQVECTADELNYVTHRVFHKINSSNQVIDYEVVCLSETKTQLSITRTLEPKIGYHLLQVHFQEPLKNKEIIAYELTIRTENTNLLTWEDFEFFNQGADVNGKKRFGARYGLQWYLLNKSEQIDLQILFPEGYPINEPRCMICRRGNMVEYMQISQENFKVCKIDDRICLGLYLQDTLIVLPHTIFWNPPSVSELLETHYITHEEAQKIYARVNLSKEVT